jgi:hypothetical protein
MSLVGVATRSRFAEAVVRLRVPAGARSGRATVAITALEDYEFSGRLFQPGQRQSEYALPVAGGLAYQRSDVVRKPEPLAEGADEKRFLKMRCSAEQAPLKP